MDGTAGGLLGPAAAGFLAGPHRNLIGADWGAAIGGGTLPVIDPGTGDTVACIADSGAADVDAAVAAARRALDHGPWGRLAASERGRLMRRLAVLLGDNAEQLAQLESLDTGRPIYECRLVDIPGSVSMLEYMAGWAGKINGQTMQLGTPGELHAYSVREPVGVVAVIVPWNYPLELAVWRIAPALAAGCTVIIKPAEQTSLTALRLGQLVLDAGFPPGVVNIVTGLGETVGAALAAHHDVDAISFTGSTEVGKLVAQAATGNLTRVFLELGGKSPCVVLADADLDAVVAAANDSIYGLHASIWTTNLRAAHQLAGRIKSGNVCINTHNFFDPAFPMGGYKQSGWGRAAGFAAIEHYTELKGVVARL